MNTSKIISDLREQKKWSPMDYLTGEGINAHFDKKTLQRIQEIEGLEPMVKDKLFFLIDTVIRDNKARKAYVV